MRKTFIMALLFLCLVSCNKEDQLRLEQLQKDLAELEQKDVAGVSDAIDPQSDDPQPFQFTFDKTRYGVDAGGSITVSYTLSQAASVEVNVKDGWSATVSGSGSTSGEIVITAPDPAGYTELVAVATAEGGKSVAAILPLMVRDPYTAASRPQIKSLGYYGFKPSDATLENFQKLADAGLNMVTVECADDDFAHQIDLAGQAGLKVLAVVIDHAGRYGNDPENYKGLDELINYLKERPEVYAYHMWDEPSVNDAYQLKLRKDKIESLDPSRPVYVNYNPEASVGTLGVENYYDYVDLLTGYLDMDMLSFDMYPILPDMIQPGWHKCLKIVSDAAQRYNIPFWTFAASCWINQETLLRAKPTVENLRLQIYTNLAYGADAVQYFTITSYGGTSFAPIMSYTGGQWTEAYDILKEANLQMQRRAFVFVDSDIDKIRYNNQMYTWDEALSAVDLPAEIKSLYTSHGALVSFVENNGNKYLAIVSNLWQRSQIFSMELNDMVYMIDREGNFVEYQPGKYENFTLEGGDMIVLKYR